MERVPRKRRASMADVARLAGVSAQTVSRYFTGVGYVRDATRERITAAIDELDYRPNQAARNLRSSRSNSIGVLAIGGLNFGSVGVLTGMSESARDSGVMLPISHLAVDFEARGWQTEARRVVEHFLSAQVDGIIVSTVLRGIEDVIPAPGDETPVLAISELPGTGYASVSMQSHVAAVMATRHLIELGHRRIAHVAGPEARNEAIERERGYRDAMSEAGLEPVVIGGARDWNALSGHEAADRVHGTDVTGVFTANDEIALGFMSAMARRGAIAPRDYSIVGIDDMPESEHFWPPLTTVRLDFPRLGREAFTLMQRMIRQGAPASHRDVAPTLTVRESAAPPTE